MSTLFPNGIDVFTNPTPTSPLTNPPHSGQHSNVNDATEALEAKVGVNDSADPNSLDYKLRNTTWLTGAGVPGAGLGSNGNLYLRTSNGVIYQKAAGTWSVIYTPPAGNSSNAVNPLLHGCLAWTYDPTASNSSTTAFTAGTIYLASFWVTSPITATNILVNMSTAAGNIFTALYDGAGALLSQSSSAVTVTNLNTRPLGAPQALTVGRYFIGVWVSSTCNAYRAIAQTPYNSINLGATTYRAATANTGLTTVAPASLGAMTSIDGPIWAGIS